MISALFAVDKTGGMGWKGGLPWPHNIDDMKWFKRMTDHQIVVMGRKTWDSVDMPKPLPGRHNILFTNQFINRDDIEQVRGDVCEALRTLEKTYRGKQLFVIGGADLLMQSRPMLKKIYITRFDQEYLNDTYIDLDLFLDGMVLFKTINLGSCTVEEYHNEPISSSTRTHSNTRKTED